MTRLNIIQDCTKFDRPLVLSMSCKSVSVCCNHNKSDLDLTKGASTLMLCCDTCVFLIFLEVKQNYNHICSFTLSFL